MLINAQRPEELRVAIITDGVLDKYEVSAADAGLLKGNIYRGTVAAVRPSLDAAFVDFGVEKHGLLRAEDVVVSAMARKPENDRRSHRIDRALERNQPVLVQVTRDSMAHKGAQLTTDLSLAGRHLVLMPLDPVRGISRKVEDEVERSALRERLELLNLPEGCGVIVRTNASGQSKAALNRDLSALLRLWKRIRAEANSGKGTRLLYSDQDLIVQALRDLVGPDIEEVLVDDEEAYDKAKGYMRSFMPRARTRLVRYEDRMPLFSRYRLEEQIDRIYQRKVDLPSGGSIVIDPTEALTAIDVNSGRARRGATQEETAVNINLEAAHEAARQLRLRDIGGLVVVDLIDMRSQKHRREIEKAVKDAMRTDKARSTVGRISPNGLLEINRQRIAKSLQLRSHRSCPTCNGAGLIASSELVALNLLRRIETRAVTRQIRGARIRLHPELADDFQNSRRQEIAALEAEFGIEIQIIAAAGFHRTEEEVEWLRGLAEPSRDDKSEQQAVTAADLADGPQKSPPPARDKKAESPEDSQTPSTNGKRRRRGGRRRRRPASVAPHTEDDPLPKPRESQLGGDHEPTSTGDDKAEKRTSSGETDAPPKKRRPRRRRRRPSGVQKTREEA
ncbi:MAG: Rne/Rng family ribonuclease [bacterium]|nr:Rne/Rng family ribonuclease [bacterium]